MKKIKLAIVGATGLVGRTVLKVLDEKKLPIETLGLFATSKSAGTELEVLNKKYIVEELTENSFDQGFDYAIFSAGGAVAAKYAPIAASKGCIVIDNSSNFRMDKDVPLVVPEVNFEDALKNNGIIANPNCSTIQAMLPLKAINDKYPIKRIVYSTYQAVSGAGKKALDDLSNQTGENLKKFKYPIYNNCLPQIDVFLDNGYTKEEMKMINETRKILHLPSLKVTATTVRVPIENSHSESINIELFADFKLEDIVKTLKEFPNIVVIDDINEEKYPMAIEATGHDEVYVGRIRRDDSVPYGINLWVVADNIRKGAASNAVQILERLIKEK